MSTLVQFAGIVTTLDRLAIDETRAVHWSGLAGYKSAHGAAEKRVSQPELCGRKSEREGDGLEPVGAMAEGRLRVRER